MPWPVDLASGLGIPTGAATLAVAMYGACVSAEKVARPQALNDIARILKDPSWEGSVQPSTIVNRVFLSTFGERQLSLRCVVATCIASLVIIIVTLVVFSVLVGSPNITVRDYGTALLYVPGIIVICAPPDYLSLWKTRILLGTMRNGSKNAFALALVLFDLCMSVFLSLLWISVWMVVIDKPGGWAADMSRFISGLTNPHTAYPVTMFPISTIFTSIWTFLILISTAVLKLLAPVHAFTAWFFDVETHPVQAIGIMAGALVMIGSLIWSVAQALV